MLLVPCIRDHKITLVIDRQHARYLILGHQEITLQYGQGFIQGGGGGGGGALGFPPPPS